MQLQSGGFQNSAFQCKTVQNCAFASSKTDHRQYFLVKFLKEKAIAIEKNAVPL
jgi:hypothetical protein